MTSKSTVLYLEFYIAMHSLAALRYVRKTSQYNSATNHSQVKVLSLLNARLAQLTQ